MAEIVPKHHIGIDRVGARKVGKGAALGGSAAAFVAVLINAGCKALSKYGLDMENGHDIWTH